MIVLTLKRLVALGAIALVPMACAPNASGVTPSAPGSRTIQSGGPAGGGGGGTGGGGGGATGGGGGGGAALCQPLPGTCVLNANFTMPARFGSLKGAIRFERSPARMAVTGTIEPGGFGPSSYFAVVLDSAPGSALGYAARGVMDPKTRIVTLETLPGDGLFSQTPNAAPVDSRFNALATTGWSFISDSTPPSADALALFESVQAGSSLHIGTLGVPGQTCPCPAPGPVAPAVLLYDMPPAQLR